MQTVTKRRVWKTAAFGGRKNGRLLGVVHALLTEGGPKTVDQITSWLQDNKGRMYHLPNNQLAQMMAKRPALFRKEGHINAQGFLDSVCRVALWAAIPQGESE